MESDSVNIGIQDIGARLRQARVAAGLTQDEAVSLLAQEGVRLTKAGLSKYERGGSTPKPTIIRGLATAYGVEAGFFLEERGVEIEWLAFRKAARLGKTAQQRVKAIAESQVDAFVALRNALEPWRDAEATILAAVQSVNDIEGAALSLRQHWDLGLQPIESVTGAIEDSGGIVVELDDDEDLFDGLSGWADESTPIVAVSRAVTDDRRRFSLAHELGHLVMKIEAKLDEKTEERWAHRFAAAFLVPAEVAKRELGDRRRHLDFRELMLLKQKHGLSMSAWIFRASDLGIIEESHARTLFAEMGQRGWRRHEPVEFEGQEQPTGFRQLTVRALAEGILSRTQAERLCPGVTRDIEDAAASPATAMDPRSLHRLPRAERERLMEQAAAVVEKDYRKGNSLDGFDAMTEEDHSDDPL